MIPEELLNYEKNLKDKIDQMKLLTFTMLIGLEDLYEQHTLLKKEIKEHMVDIPF